MAHALTTSLRIGLVLAATTIVLGCGRTGPTIPALRDTDASPGRDADLAPDADAGDLWTVRVVDAPIALPCSPGHWCWEHPLPQGESIFDARALADGSTWAVGPRGTALRFDARGWTAVPIPTTQAIVSIWGPNANDVWAAGQLVNGGFTLLERSLWHWNGSAWTRVATPPGLSPARIDGSSGSDFWLLSDRATREGSTVWHYDGTSFSPRGNGLPGEPTLLSSLWVEAPGRVWTFGQAVDTGQVMGVYLYDRGAWSRIRSAWLHGRIGGAQDEVFAHVGSSSVAEGHDVVRLTPGNPGVETLPGVRGGWDDTIVSGNGQLWAVAAALHRRSAGAWQTVDVVPGVDAIALQPLTIFAPDATGGGFGFNGHGDMYRTVSPTRIAPASTPWRPRISGFAGRGPQPLAAITLTPGPVMPRDASADWAHPSTAPEGGPGGRDVTALIVSDTLVPAFARRSDGALVEVAASGAAGAVVSPDGMVIAAASANDGAAWAVAGNLAMHFDAGRFRFAAPPPEMIDTVDSRQVTFTDVWNEGEHAYVAGRYQMHSEIPAQLVVLCEFVGTTSVRCVTIRTTQPEGFKGLWSQDSGHPLWVLFEGRLASIDRVSLAITTAPLSLTYEGAPLTLRALRGNDRTGNLIALAGPNVTAALAILLEPARRVATLLPVPLSQYAAYVNDVYPGDDGSVWAMTESAQIVRYQP